MSAPRRSTSPDSPPPVPGFTSQEGAATPRHGIAEPPNEPVHHSSPIRRATSVPRPAAQRAGSTPQPAPPARPEFAPVAQSHTTQAPPSGPRSSPAPFTGAPAQPDPSQAASAGVGLTKVYGTGDTRVVALDGVSVGFARGSFSAIMGPSGSGKSTLMHCLAGLDRITDGRVFLAGTELSALPDKGLTRARRDQVGFIFQSFNLLPTLTARQNILLPLDLAGTKPDKALFDSLVEGLGIADRLAHRPSELSGGQQQRVACARAMITKPSVVFADEPTGALDSHSGTALLSYLRHCATDLGQTIIMVTHDARAASYADRVLMLLDGRIVDDIASPTADVVAAAMAALEV